MDNRKVAKELLKMAKELTALHSGPAQLVIQKLKPVSQEIVKLREAMRKNGDYKEADQMYLDLTGIVNDLIKAIKKY